MMTLADAWTWYQTVREQAGLFGRIGRKYWDDPPLQSALWKDDRLKEVKSETIVQGAEFCLDHLDDFAVLILSSVFESIVRDRAKAEVRGERERLTHPLIIGIVDAAKDDIENGSFSRVLDAYKAGIDKNLVQQVDQVRKYRNWVAHGRRGEKSENVEPESAYDRLRRFLDELDRSGLGTRSATEQ